MRGKLEIKGIIPPIVTPLTDSEELDEQGLRRVCNLMIDAGVHGIFPLGSQGEFWAFDMEEKRRILEIAVEEVGGQVPVYAGTGGATTREAIKLTKMAESIGVDCVSVITPYYIYPSQDELYEHYTAIAGATALPIILYNNPGRTGGVNLKPETVKRLSKIDNIIGIKDSSGDLGQTSELIRLTGDDFAVLAGRDTQILAVLVYGGKGAVAATANVAPRLVVEIYERFIKGDIEGALRAQRTLAPLRNAFGLASFPVVVKEAMNLIGWPSGPARSPVGRIAGEARVKLIEILKELGLSVVVGS
ncbi:MAG: 4-hydroxy-tetrahydrodipicolinate synthase [Firmicutes bacterium]|nr:4-hydroxy-tetrahydrodipicolinate synthase [Bacillota bacterium]